MKTFAELFKKYRLRAEFDTFSAFSDALSEKGYFYEESIFSHWQKGTRVPAERKLVLSIIEIFVEKGAIKTKEEADEFLAATKLGYLTKQEMERLNLSDKKLPPLPNSRSSTIPLLSVVIILGGLFLVVFYLQSLLQKNTTAVPSRVSSIVTEPKRMVVGVDATLNPMEYVENGKLVGYDIDLANLIGKELDAQVEFRNIFFDNLFTSLDQQQINVIISAVTITPERQQKYDFSDQYLNAGQVIITRKVNNLIKSTADLKGKKIAVQTGTTNEIEALKYTSDNLVIRYTDFLEATKALVNGKVDAEFSDTPGAKGIISVNPTLKIVGPPFTEDNYGIVLLKGDPSLTQINEALTSLRKKGILTKLEQKWLK